MLFILIALVQNFADDNSLNNIATAVDSLKQTLESECKVAIKWFYKNKMIVNPDESQVIVLDMHILNQISLMLNLLLFQAVPLVDILGIKIKFV